MSCKSIVGFVLFLSLLHGAYSEQQEVTLQLDSIRVLKRTDLHAALSEAASLLDRVDKEDTHSRIKVLELLADLYKDDLQYDQAAFFYLQQSLLADSVGDMNLKFRGMYDRASILSSLGRYDSAIAIYKELLLQTEPGSYPLVRAKAFMELGTLFRYKGSEDLAYSYYLKARDIFTMLGPSYLLSKGNFDTAEIFMIQKNYTLTLDYLSKALETLRETEDYQRQGYLYARMGNVYETLDVHGQAHAYFDSARVMFQKIGYRRGIANVQRKLGKTFRRLKMYDSAMVYFQNALETFQTIGNKRQVSMIYRQMSIVERKQNHIPQALEYALKSLQAAKELKNPETYYQASGEMSNVYQAGGDYRKALEYQKVVVATKRELLSSALDQQLGAVESYNNLEKSLLLKKDELDRLEVTSRRRTIYMLVVIIGLLGLFIVFAYRQYVRDVSRMKEIERQNQTIKEKNEQIATHMNEFKKFAYVSSHDLKAPLRGISNISDWLKNDYAQQLDIKGLELFDLLKSRVYKMEQVINGTAAYFKIDSNYIRPVNLDIKKTVESIKRALMPGKNYYVTVNDPVLALEVDQPQFYQVIFNLIDNGCRHNGKPFVKIEVGFTRRDDAWYLYVKDNGDGIEEKYHTKIFEMFQTLGNEQDESHTGMGLAIVKKITESWGGDIFVESEPGHGSTFFIRLSDEMIVHAGDIDSLLQTKAV